MKTDPPIFFAVQGDDAEAFRETMRRQVVTLARRRRRGRAIRRGLAGAAAFAVFAAIWLRPWAASGPGDRGPGDRGAAPGVAMVASQPLAPGVMVRTGGADFAVVGSGFAGIAVIDSRPLDIAITETRLAAPAFDYWNDRQLLAAFPGQRAALIDPGTARARLIFY